MATSGIGELLHRITDDVKTIATDEVELARYELSSHVRGIIVDVAVIVLAAVVGLIGFGLLCTAAVAALAPVIPSLALRLVLMSIVYLIVGGIAAAVFASRLRRGARTTVAHVTEPLSN